MTSLQTVLPLPVTEWPEELNHIVETMQGHPIHVHQLMAHNPGLLNAWWNFRNYAVNGGSLGGRKGELVILRVAVQMRSWYEWGSHVDRGIKCGISFDEIKKIDGEIQPEDWPEDELILLRAVDELLETQQLSKITRQQMQPYFTLPQVMDLIAIHGMYLILACMLKTWDLELDPSVEARLPDGVNKDSFLEASSPVNEGILSR